MTAEDKREELTRRKKELQEERASLVAAGCTDQLELDILDEEIADITFQLRVAREGHRRNTKFAAFQKDSLFDRQQFYNWTRESEDAEDDVKKQAMLSAMHDASFLLTERQFAAYTRWANGSTNIRTAKEWGITHESVSSLITRGRKKLNAEAERRTRGAELQSLELDPTDEKTSKAISSTLTLLQAVVLTLRMKGYSRGKIAGIIGQTRSSVQSAENHAYGRLAKHYDGAPVWIRTSPDAMTQLIEQKYGYRLPDTFTPEELVLLREAHKKFRNVWLPDSVQSGRTSAAWKRKEAANKKSPHK